VVGGFLAARLLPQKEDGTMTEIFQINYVGFAVSAIVEENGIYAVPLWRRPAQPVDELYLKDKSGRWVQHDLMRPATAAVALEMGMPS
jgi:hypothetical protein